MGCKPVFSWWDLLFDKEISDEEVLIFRPARFEIGRSYRMGRGAATGQFRAGNWPRRKSMNIDKVKYNLAIEEIKY